MTVKTLFAALSLTLAAAPGFAADAMQPAAMTMSRIDVRAAMATAMDTHLQRGEGYGTVVPVSTLSRATVLAELQAAREAGLIVAGSESHGMFRDGDLRSTRSRAQVLADAPARVGLSRGERVYSGS